MFKPKVSLVAEVIRCLSLTYDDHVLDSRSVFSVSVVARFCLIMSSWTRQGGWTSSPFETVIPGFNGVLLYAMGEV